MDICKYVDYDEQDNKTITAVGFLHVYRTRYRIYVYDNNGYKVNIEIGKYIINNSTDTYTDTYKVQSSPYTPIDMPLNKYESLIFRARKDRTDIFDIKDDLVKRYLDNNNIKPDKFNVKCNVTYKQLEEIYNIICGISIERSGEKSCKNCGKKNDIGICSCWWCGINKPTE